MADKKYVDADCDFSSYLKMSDLGSHLHSSSSSEHVVAHDAGQQQQVPAAFDFLSLMTLGGHVRPPAHQVQAPTINDVARHQQAPAAFHLLSRTLGGHVPPAAHQFKARPAPHVDEHQQVPAAFDFLSLMTVGGPHHRMPTTAVDVCPRQILAAPEQVQGSGAGGPSITNENHKIRYFTVPDSSSDHQGQFLHAIIDGTHVDVDGGHARRGESLYHDLCERMGGWLHEFTTSGVETTTMKNNSRGLSLKDTSPPGFLERNSTNISAPPQMDGAQQEVQVGLLNQSQPASPVSSDETQPAPAANKGEEATPGSSQPNAGGEAFDWTGFHPVILESSLAPAYDGSTSSTMYPSVLTNIGTSEVRFSMPPPLTHAAPKISKKGSEDSTEDPDLSSPSFRRLCRKDDTFRKHACRIKELSRIIIKLEDAGSDRKFLIKQRIEMYKQEKALLFAIIKKGLLEMMSNMSNSNAGPSEH